MLRIDARSSRELQALILSVRRANKAVQAEIRTHTKTMAAPEWQKAVAEQALSRFEHVVLVSTARVTVSNQNVTLKAGGLAKKLSGGGRAYEVAKGAEFGSGQARRTKQFRPFNRKGYVVYPAAAGIIPRLAALWAQTAARTFYEALEGKYE